MEITAKKIKIKIISYLNALKREFYYLFKNPFNDKHKITDFNIYLNNYSKLKIPVYNFSTNLKKSTTQDAKIFLTPLRFDIMAKYIYAKYKEKAIDSDWHTKLYLEHIKTWNNYNEKIQHGGVSKKSKEDFLSSYNELMASIKNNGFNNKKSRIWINKNGNLLNGSHRVASCILFNKEISCEVKPSESGQLDCSTFYFIEKRKTTPNGIRNESLDRMALEYAKLKETTHIATVFPSASGHEHEIIEILTKYAGIVYEKKISLNEIGAFHFVKILYEDDPWSGDIKDKFAGVKNKVRPCFTNNDPVWTILLDTDKLENLNKAKQEIRDLLKLDKHSIHINDSHKETVRVAEAIYNKNSLHFLNNSSLFKKTYLKFDSMLHEFKDWVSSNNINPEDICIDASSVLSAYGIREGRDIDFLHNNKIPNPKIKKYISSHNEYAHYYGKNIDEIIYNPENHFYYLGIKFTTLGVLKMLKKARNEKKDKKDINLMKKYE